MQQKNLALEASFERLGGENEQQQSLDQMEQVATWTEPCRLELVNLRRLAWRGIKLCTSFLQRWFNLCEVGAEEVFFALTMLRSFAGVDFAPATSPRESAALHSIHLLGEQEFSSSADSPAQSRIESESAISWRTPWLYLVFLLLVWLLLF